MSSSTQTVQPGFGAAGTLPPGASPPGSGSKPVEPRTEGTKENQPEVWAPYKCRTINFGAVHPGHLVEASVLAAVDLPEADYPLEKSLESQIEQKTLSNMQLEGVMYASMRFQKKLGDDKFRAGFYLGDSAGVGKGRQISGIILDNLLRGRKKHCWFSVASDLHIDATRDLRDIGCMVNVLPSIAALSELKGDEKRGMGVLFSTYSGLTSKGKMNSAFTRFDELMEWLCDGKPKEEFDGVIIFDEAHKAKNFRAEDEDSTKVGQAVHRLQDMLPNARVLYASATCVSHVDDMQYMTRLGYWGRNCAYENFEQFREAMTKADVTGMELLAVDLKTTGRAVVRNVSYQGAEFSIAVSSLSTESARIYREACIWWHDVLEAIKLAKDLCTSGGSIDEEERVMQNGDNGGDGDGGNSAGGGGGRDYATVMSQYWGAHQRFFGQLILSIKVNLAVAEVKKALANGMCAVIGLQSVGGAALTRELEEGESFNEDLESNGIISVCRSVARLFMKKSFPVAHKTANVRSDPSFAFYQPSADDLLGVLKELGTKNEWEDPITQLIFEFTFDPSKADSVKWPMYRSDGTVVEADRLRQQLLDRLDAMMLPPCALDDLIDKLGGPDAVAEMTGRTIRQVRTAKGNFVVESRDRRAEKEAADKKSSNHGVAPQKTQWWVSSLENKHAEADSLNVLERETFLRGDKLVAVISAAASTGISLHADRNVANQRRRFHCTLELPWAADQAIQQLGRTHRTNQSSAPVYCLISSGLGGENRFVSSVARRLQNLGAITQGDRRASVGAMSLGDLQLESKPGTQALKELFRSSKVHRLPGEEQDQAKLSFGTKWETIVQDSRGFIDADYHGVKKKKKTADGAEEELSRSSFCPVSLCKSELEFLQIVRAGLFALDMEMKKDKSSASGGMRKKRREDVERYDVAKFLNRLLGLPFTHQTILFNYFCAILEVKMSEYDAGVRNIDGKVTRLKPKRLVYRDKLGRPVHADVLKVDQSMSFDEAVREVKFRLARAKEGPATQHNIRLDSFAIEPKISDSALEFLLEEAAEHQIGFRLNAEREGAPGINRAILTCPPKVAGSTNWTVFRVYNGTGTGWLDENQLTRLYYPSTDAKLVRKEWNAAYRARLTHTGRDGVEVVTILTGNLIPILPHVMKLEQSKQQVDAYLVVTEQGERILGIKPDEPKKLEDALNEKRELEAQMRLNYGEISVTPPWNFGFDITPKGDLTRITAKGKELGLKDKFTLLMINHTHFQPDPKRITDLQSAVEFYLANNEYLKQIPSVAISFTLSRPKDDIQEETVETPAEVSYSTMLAILRNPKKERKARQKEAKELQELFGSDSEEEELKGSMGAMLKNKRSVSVPSNTAKKSKTKGKRLGVMCESDSDGEEENRSIKTSVATPTPVGAKRLLFPGARVTSSVAKLPLDSSNKKPKTVLESSSSINVAGVPLPMVSEEDEESLLGFDFRKARTL